MKKIIFFFSLVLTTFFGIAQDIHFSQFSETPLLINPANVGFFDGYQRAILNYRSQWTSAGSPFKTMAASVDGEIGLKRNRTTYIGIGGTIYQDVAGAANWKQFEGTLYSSAVVKVAKKSHVSLGLGAGYAQNSANFSSLTFGNQYNGQEFSTELPSFENFQFRKYSYLDLSTGMVFEYKNTTVNFDRNDLFDLRVGLAAYHLNQPKLQFATSSDQKLDRRLTAFVEGRYDLKGTNISFLPSLIFMQQGKFSQINTGLLTRLRFLNQTKITGVRHETALLIGAYTRIGDAIIPQVFLEMFGFNIGLSYDYNISSYKTATNGTGGFEISLKWTNLRDGLFKQGREFGKGKGGASSAPTPAD